MSMKLIEKLAQEYIKEAYVDPEDTFAEKCSALSGFKEGFRAAREMAADIAYEYPKGPHPQKLLESMKYSVVKIFCPAMAKEILWLGEEEV